MESKLMDQWKEAFAKDFYRQQKADQKRKAAMKQRLIIATITIGVICLTIIIL